MTRIVERVVHIVKWKSVPGFEHIRVCSNGMIKNKHFFEPQFIHSKTKKLYVVLRRKERGIMIKKRFDMHFLVWTLFGGTEKIHGYEIHHINGNNQDNRIENLEYITRTEHLAKHGRIDRKNLFTPKSCDK